MASATLTVLIGAPSWAGLAMPARAGQNPGCPPLNPIAKRYVDRKTVCRRARQEIMHGLKTGKDPDWGNVLRDSIPAKHHRGHRPPKHRHPTSPGRLSRPKPKTEPGPSTRSNPTPARPRTPTRRTIAPAQPQKSVTVSPSTAPTNRTAIPRRTRGKKGPLDKAASTALLLALTALGGVAVWRRKALSALLHQFRPHHTRPRFDPQPCLVGRWQANAASLDPFGWGGTSLTGPDAEDAVRHLLLNALTHQREHVIELVLAHADACRLLGISADDLRYERVPGLILTDDHRQAHAHLRRPGFSRRLLITYDHGDDGPHSQLQQDERSSVLTIGASTRPPVLISADEDVRPRLASEPTPTEPSPQAPLLSRNDAREQLLALPTLAR
ncbi:hypothetical protein ACFYTC_18510 [Actinomadura nitritigenes]|uniref:hypothetical protein n=1 Tax=Actinomadura nitritigenes TaxID=134602 RepID=UPI0036B1972F